MFSCQTSVKLRRTAVAVAAAAAVTACGSHRTGQNSVKLKMMAAAAAAHWASHRRGPQQAPNPQGAHCTGGRRGQRRTRRSSQKPRAAHRGSLGTPVANPDTGHAFYEGQIFCFVHCNNVLTSMAETLHLEVFQWAKRATSPFTPSILVMA